MNDPLTVFMLVVGIPCGVYVLASFVRHVFLGRV